VGKEASSIGVPVPELGGLTNDELVSEIPQRLGRDIAYNEDVLTLQAGNILVGALDTLGNLALVLVTNKRGGSVKHTRLKLSQTIAYMVAKS
jgi:hypothetical protein